ncbi:hypothetical protein D9619_012601 [Psilocybe cf. subviscida]|uniref:Uncharacterized protein n=1 Tax=Psilocybe cf. subviscida TaxID=2480587 RepID=A0A8H5B849_9AGAR|nr:hypothetical protein D9619_012601 [Psilocybe cf. subviscida]
MHFWRQDSMTSANLSLAADGGSNFSTGLKNPFGPALIGALLAAVPFLSFSISGSVLVSNGPSPTVDTSNQLQIQ